MLRLFYGNQSYALLLAPVLIGVYGGVNHFLGIYPWPEGSLDLGLWGKAPNLYPLLSQLLAGVLIFVSASLLNALFNRNEFFDRNTFLPVILYITASSFFPHFYYLSGFGIAAFLLCLSFWSFFQLHQNEDARRIVFNASILWSLGASFFPLLYFMLPFVYFIIWVFRSFKLRESVIIFLGIVIPLIYVSAYHYILGDFSFSLWHSSSEIHIGIINVIIVSASFILFTLLSLGSFLKNLSQGSIRIRKLNTMVMWFSIAFTGVAVSDFILYQHTGSSALLLIPSVFVLPYAFGKKNLRKESAALFYVFFLLSVGKFFLTYLF